MAHFMYLFYIVRFVNFILVLPECEEKVLFKMTATIHFNAINNKMTSASIDNSLYIVRFL